MPVLPTNPGSGKSNAGLLLNFFTSQDCLQIFPNIGQNKIDVDATAQHQISLFLSLYWRHLVTKGCLPTKIHLQGSTAATMCRVFASGALWENVNMASRIVRPSENFYKDLSSGSMYAAVFSVCNGDVTSLSEGDLTLNNVLTADFVLIWSSSQSGVFRDKTDGLVFNGIHAYYTGHCLRASRAERLIELKARQGHGLISLQGMPYLKVFEDGNIPPLRFLTPKNGADLYFLAESRFPQPSNANSAMANLGSANSVGANTNLVISDGRLSVSQADVLTYFDSIRADGQPDWIDFPMNASLAGFLMSRAFVDSGNGYRLVKLTDLQDPPILTKGILGELLLQFMQSTRSEGIFTMVPWTSEDAITSGFLKIKGLTSGELRVTSRKKVVNLEDDEYTNVLKEAQSIIADAKKRGVPLSVFMTQPEYKECRLREYIVRELYSQPGSWKDLAGLAAQSRNSPTGNRNDFYRILASNGYAAGIKARASIYRPPLPEEFFECLSLEPLDDSWGLRQFRESFITLPGELTKCQGHLNLNISSLRNWTNKNKELDWPMPTDVLTEASLKAYVDPFEQDGVKADGTSDFLRTLETLRFSSYDE